MQIEINLIVSIYFNFKHTKSYLMKAKKIILIVLLILNIKAWVNQEIYHTNQELEEDIDTLIKDNPNIIIKNDCQSDNQIHYLQTNQSLLQNNANSNKKISAIIICNEHARQLITAEACLDFVKKLLLDENRSLLKSIKFTIFYNANPQVRDKVLEGEYCLRKDQNQIDVNRNFPYRFKTNDQFWSQVYPGTVALSQNYPKCLDKVASEQTQDQNVVNSYLNIHSGQFSFYLPRCDGVQNGYQKQYEILTKVREQYCPNCIFKQTQISENGNSFEDMKCRKGFEYSGVFQIYGGQNQNLQRIPRCWIMFNPTNTQFYNFYINKTTQMLFTYYKELKKNVFQPNATEITGNSHPINIRKIY